METLKSYPLHSQFSSLRVDEFSEFIFRYRTEFNSFNQGIGCIVRAAPGSLEEEDLHFSSEDQNEVGQDLLEQDEELISDIITITPVVEQSVLAVSEIPI